MSVCSNGHCRETGNAARRFSLQYSIGRTRSGIPLSADRILVIYSFNASRLVTIWGGWSLAWYRELLHDDAVLEAAWTSLRVAFLSASAATILGTLGRHCPCPHGPISRPAAVFRMIYAPLVMPEVITGLSLLLLFVAFNVDRGFWTIVIAHTTLTMCFVTVIVQSRLADFDRSLEEAAMDLGCPPFQDFSDHHVAADCAGNRCGLDACLFPVARRSRDCELHHRARRHDVADPDLFRSAHGR